jgi:tetratricopeptide (TPR) repeat protein
LDEAEEMYMRALKGKEKALSVDHTSTLDTVNNLGNLYKNQGKLDEAEEMYMRALKGKEKTLGVEYTSTLDTVNKYSSRSDGLMAVQQQAQGRHHYCMNEPYYY